jgi:hypothetical protein
MISAAHSFVNEKKCSRATIGYLKTDIEMVELTVDMISY